MPQNPIKNLYRLVLGAYDPEPNGIFHYLADHSRLGTKCPVRYLSGDWICWFKQNNIEVL